MDSVPQEMVIPVYMSDEMIAAGLEAKREAEILCLEEGQIVREIYLAMYGTGVKCCCEGEESFH